MNRDDVGRRVMETAQMMADGFRHSMREGNEIENELNRQCAIAVSNTGVFILYALGFSQDEVKALAGRDAVHD